MCSSSAERLIGVEDSERIPHDALSTGRALKAKKAAIATMLAKETKAKRKRDDRVESIFGML